MITSINRNIVFNKLIINTLLVLIGYGLATLYGQAINLVFQPIKSIFLIYSMFGLIGFYQNDKHLKRVYIFSFMVLLTIIFSVSPLISVSRVIVMILPIIYVAVSMRVLFLQYKWETILTALLKSFRWIFILPLASFVLFGGDLSQTDFYGEIVGAFVSNHYGWGAFVFITSHWTLVQFKQSKLFSIWSVAAVFYFVLLIFSGSRSGLLSLAVSFIFWFFTIHGNIFFKTAFSGILIYLIISLTNSDSAISQRVEKTEVQFETTASNTEQDYYANTAISDDTRATARAVANIAFKDHPFLFLTGMGIFAFNEGLIKYAGWADSTYFRSGVHNSYGELYFGSGLIVFAYFFWFFTLQPFLIYLRYLRIPFLGYVGIVLIIPFFESNLTAGQFLFYPWFIAVFFMVYFKEQIKNPLEQEDIGEN